MLETQSSATVLILTPLNESSIISSAIAITSTSGTSSPIATATTGHSRGGMSQSNDINLGVGIGLGFPSFIVALLSAWLAFRSYRRKRKHLTQQGTDVESISTSTIDSGGGEENGNRTP